MRLDCQVAALSEGVVKRQVEFDEKAQSLSAMVSRRGIVLNRLSHTHHTLQTFFIISSCSSVS